ncbi:hypothetical protein GCM10009610_58290 [Pseudonocardia xinjiangensis]
MRDPAAAFLDLRPSDAQVEKYYGLGTWRDGTPLDDLRRWREESPESVAVIAHRADSGIRRITYREYAEYVERFAGALHELGVRVGDVVAVQLPNWWQMNALVLACARIGAVVAPMVMTIRERELERVLARLRARVCVTADRWEGFDHSAALAELAPRLPELRHRVVLGASVGDDEVDFVRHFQEAPWEPGRPDAPAEAGPDPDRAFLVLFTSGTSGEPKAALHTLNTLYASSRDFAAVDRVGTHDRLFTSAAVTHYVGIQTCILIPLLGGAAGVLMDVWEPEAAAALAAEAGVTYVHAVPLYFGGLLTVVQDQHRALPALRAALTGATTIPGDLVALGRSLLDLPIRAVFGTTEIGLGTMTRPDDPFDRAAHSIGRPFPGTELDLRADHEITLEQPARLFVRGGAVCLATLGRDSGALIVTGEHDDGWYDTGDLAVPEEDGGVRLAGRAGDRIGGVLMIPVSDVESALRTHPAVDDVALVGYPDDTGSERACAVVVADPASAPPTLADLRHHLDALKMTEWYQPSRLELVRQLPRNSIGKVQKELLRRWVRGEGDLPEERKVDQDRGR